MERFAHHHAFLMIGSKTAAEACYVELSHNKDIEVSFIAERNLSIDTARQIKEIATQTTHKQYRYIVVASYSMGHEAQNALLKTVEELPLSKKIIFFVESKQSLLTTFISRCAKLMPYTDSVNSGSHKTKSYHIKDLLIECESICQNIKEEELTKSAATAFIDELICHTRHNHDTVRKLLYFKSCISKLSSSVKQILESAVVIAL